jgi:hypothetical protein
LQVTQNKITELVCTQEIVVSKTSVLGLLFLSAKLSEVTDKKIYIVFVCVLQKCHLVTVHVKALS